MNYVHNNYKELIKLSKEEIDIHNYVLNLYYIKESKVLLSLNEMAILRKDITGLAFDLYIDTTQTGERSGHKGSPRLKFGYGENPRNGDFKPMLLTEPFNAPEGLPKKVKTSEFKQLQLFAKANIDGLIKLYKNEVGYNCDMFIANMKRVSSHGKILEPSKKTVPLYRELDDVGANTILIKWSDSNTYNYIDKNTKKVIFTDEYGTPYRFLYGNKFKEDKGKYITSGVIDTTFYILYRDGTMKQM